MTGLFQVDEMRSESESRPLVVIVDDDPSVRRALSRCLRAAGLEVEALASAGELLAYEWPAQPACLVIDIHLPDMDGLALLRCLAGRRSRVPVVVITGDLDPELRSEALRQGAAGFLTKPYDEGQLLETIRGALDR
jgi:FixJ family two-component response regulator